jgi:hypothetical protein
MEFGSVYQRKTIKEAAKRGMTGVAKASADGGGHTNLIALPLSVVVIVNDSGAGCGLCNGVTAATTNSPPRV